MGRAAQSLQGRKRRMQLFSPEIDSRDICQGALGDCWLLAAIACLAEHDGAIQAVTKEVNPRGKYVLRLYDGQKESCGTVWWSTAWPVFAGVNGDDASIASWVKQGSINRWFVDEDHEAEFDVLATSGKDDDILDVPGKTHAKLNIFWCVCLLALSSLSKRCKSHLQAQVRVRSCWHPLFLFRAMSFAKKLGQAAFTAQKSCRDQWVEETLGKFMAECEAAAARGKCEHEMEADPPSLARDEAVKHLKSRLGRNVDNLRVALRWFCRQCHSAEQSSVICERFEIPDDVAGATLMALGCNGAVASKGWVQGNRLLTTVALRCVASLSPGPELALNMINIWKPSSIGVGAVVGGEVFNVLVIIGTAVLATPQEYMPLKLSKLSFNRDPQRMDIFFYIASVLLLYITLHDGEVNRTDPQRGSLLRIHDNFVISAVADPSLANESQCDVDMVYDASASAAGATKNTEASQGKGTGEHSKHGFFLHVGGAMGNEVTLELLPVDESLMGAGALAAKSSEACVQAELGRSAGLVRHLPREPQDLAAEVCGATAGSPAPRLGAC
eukprot:Skav234885  [mRNA]  locus=scaffold840:462015:481830:- [translate_table: standard]